MDVCRHKRRFGYLTSLLHLLLMGCGESKTAATIFPLSSSECIALSKSDKYIVRWTNGEITIETGKNREQFLREFVEPRRNELEFVEQDTLLKPANFRIVPQATASPNWGPRAIGAPTAWSRGINGEGVIVAVVDTGVDINHSQLQGRIFTNSSELQGTRGVDDDNNGYIDDLHGWNFTNNRSDQIDEVGHGTHISGVIAADSTLGRVMGVAPRAKILPLDFMDRESGTASNAILSINYAVRMGARIINASWSSSACSKNLELSVRNFENQGILMSVAAGNSGSDLLDSPEFPAAFNSTAQITVGASTVDFLRAGFSNYGNLVHVMAPGAGILSLFPDDSYQSMDGTSMAAPFVSGLAALLWQHRPQASLQQIRSSIFNGVATGNFLVKYRGEIRVPNSLSVLEQLVP